VAVGRRRVEGAGGRQRGWKGTPPGMREGRSSSPSRGKRVEKEAAREGGNGEDGRREGVEGVPIYTSILNLLR